MADLESGVRTAAEAYLGALVQDQSSAAHPEVVKIYLEHGKLSESDKPFGPGKILSVLVLPAGLTAVAQVQWPRHGGWLTLLVDHGLWVVISAVSSSTQGAVTPADMAAACNACSEYCGANRACDGPRMENVFHPLCRLTYSGPEDSVVVKSQPVFVQMVNDRYSTPMHAPYAHLRDDPRVAAEDTMIGVTFAAPDVCMVMLKVGHPPMLWTDVLTCARIDGNWWIVAKSSCNEPLLKDEARPV